ncbi:MAG: FG-GAP repeat domain-containing protein [Candidatus Methylomirabilales bacterium]
MGVGVSGGSGGFGVSSGVQLSSRQDPVMNSAMMGAALGSLGGPIGLGVGAILGYLHGLNERERMEKQTQSEMMRQVQIDNELERQIEAKRQGSSQNGPGPGSGLILLEDHLAAEPHPGPTPPSVAPPSSGEGLILLTDHLAPPKPQGSSPPAAKNQGAPLTGRMQAQIEEEGFKKDEEALGALEEEIAAARERKRKLLAQLKGTPAARDPAGIAGSPAPKPLPAIDPEGFRPIYEGGRLVRKERDVNGDGKPDIFRHYDATGRLLRQEEDSRLTGRLDTWTFYEDGQPVRKESDTDGDGKADLWAFFDGAGDLARTEADTDQDGHRDRTILYAGEEMVEEQRFSPGLDPPRVVVTYAKGEPARKEEDTDGDGRMDRLTEYDGSGHVTKMSRDPSGRGTFTLFAYYQPETGEVVREEEDLDGDNRIDVISHYEKGRLVRREFFDLPEVASLKPALSLPKLPSDQEMP